MLRPIFGLILVVASCFTCNLLAQATSYMTSDSAIHLWGAIGIEDLAAEPYAWIPTSEQQEASAEIPDWATELEDLEVDIFLGTWCGDSKTWVTAFIQQWEDYGLSPEQLHLTALHSEGDNRKQGPNDETIGLNIHRVPTFIFRRAGQEVGRIVERPLNGLEIDIQQIALDVPSAPRYRAVHRMHQLLQEEPIDSIYANWRKYYRQIRREVSSSSELNGYGYILKAQGRKEAALLVFRMNIALFRYTPNCYDSLGELYMEMKDWGKAKNCFEKVLRLKDEDDRASEMLSIIEEEIRKEVFFVY